MTTEKQRQLIDNVRSKLEGKDWFQGVCLDHLPSDREIDDDFDGCVESIIVDTEFWDNPSLFG
jgi:hypothetical protein